MLKITDVHFAFDSAPVLRGVSMAVGAGGLVGILGPNGSGKTTLLRLIAGALEPDLGRVTIDGTDVSAIPRRELARRLAVVPQETQLAFDYTALEIVPRRLPARYALRG